MERPLRILIVDDSPEFRAAAQELLEHRNHVVVASVGSGDDAIDACTRLAVDLALVDVRLGDERGTDLAHALVTTCPGLAVVLVSHSDLADSSVVDGRVVRGFIVKTRLSTTDLRTFVER